MRQTLCITSMNTLNVSTEMDNDNNTMDTFSCSPPSNERSGDSPARRRQHRSYQAIINSRRLQEFCDMVSALMVEAILYYIIIIMCYYRYTVYD